jgi:hypothetical protein
LDKCDSAVSVNLCPAAPGPTRPATPVSPVTASPTLTTTVPAGTRPPTAGDVTLLLEAVGAEDNVYQPGESVKLQLTLHNGHITETLRGVIIGATLDNALDLLGAAARTGDIRLAGQELLLTGATLAPRQDLVVHLDAAIRPETASGTVITLRATARTNSGNMVDSNELRLEVWGEGMTPPLAGGTPLGAVTPIGGGPEILPTNAPAQPPAQSPILPPTSTGMPIVGIMLGGGVLLARQLRLRRSGRREPE